MDWRLSAHFAFDVAEGVEMYQSDGALEMTLKANG